MTQVAQIFNYISMVNPQVSYVSSLGSFISDYEQGLSDGIRRKIMEALPQESLAYKIASSMQNKFSDKQLWVMAYALEKNNEFTQMVVDFYSEIERKENMKKAASNAKKEANKANSQPVLDFVKENGKLLKDYYSFLKSNKKYAKEFFSKKYTMESATEFINF